MEIKIEVPKIHCARTTSEIFKDEVYYGIIAIAGKMEQDQFILSSQTPVFSKISEVKERVKEGTSWRPSVNNHSFSIDNDSKVVAVSLVLYEKDKGDIYDQLSEQFNEIVEPNQFDWNEIIEAAKEIIIRDVNDNKKTDFEDILDAITNKPAFTPMIIGGFLFKVVKEVVKYLRQDDLLGSTIDNFNLDEDGFDLPREYDFRRHKGKYKVGLKVSKV